MLKNKCIHRFRLRTRFWHVRSYRTFCFTTPALPKRARVSSVRGTAMLCGPAKSITGVTTAGPRKPLAKKESENIDLRFI